MVFSILPSLLETFTAKIQTPPASSDSSTYISQRATTCSPDVLEEIRESLMVRWEEHEIRPGHWQQLMSNIRNLSTPSVITLTLLHHQSRVIDLQVDFKRAFAMLLGRSDD
jgi:hypothetical protein